MAEAKKAVLYNKQYPVLSVEIQRGKVMKIGELQDRDHLPICLWNTLTLETINTWLSSRKIPDEREGLRDARMMFRDFEVYHHMFSLSDQYWFCYSTRDKWEALNYFNNEYPTDAGRIFFTPWSVKEENLKKESPNLTTNGVLRKCWVQSGDLTSRLYKAGSQKYHQEPLSEVLASRMMEKLRLVPYVRYDLAPFGLRMCSVCKNFVNASTEFVPASHLYRLEPKPADQTHFEHILHMADVIGMDRTEVEEYLVNMIAVDQFIRNTDRHLGNFGFLRDVDSCRFIGCAPLFDCGDAYRGTNDAVKEKRSKLFKERDAWAVKQVIGDIDEEALTKDEELMTLIASYPDIDEYCQYNIQQQIKSVHELFRENERESILRT